MRYALTAALLVLLATVREPACTKSTVTKTCYKGRLEIKGICMNYTIKVLEGKPDTGLIATSWKDENTGKVYENVFRLESVCNFPADLEEGSEFYFTIDDTQSTGGCNVCMAYYPTPPKGMAITVRKSPCS